MADKSKIDILIGLQWGDEGKGKIIDVLTRDADFVVRFQGGNNAGHTVEAEKQKYVLHLVPSGILRPETCCIIGNGVAADPVALWNEMTSLERRGVSVKNVQLSECAHLIMPWHRLLDAFQERCASGGNKIGTTLRGIGPAYMEKVGRTGFRACVMNDMPRFQERFMKTAEQYNNTYVPLGGERLDAAKAWNEVKTACEYLRPFLRDTVTALHEARMTGKNILLEGAQGTFLDVDHGTYPYVTSSNTTSGGACTGSGLAPRHITGVWGVIKAYTTRVGEGPFPTELDNDAGEYLRKKGGEYGATTGRSRRCGWLDLAACRHACLINGVDSLALTKLDVLEELDEIKICTAYRIRGKIVTGYPADIEDLRAAEPVYETLPGWKVPISGARSMDELPENTKNYIRRIEDFLGVKTGIISVGPDREQTFLRLPDPLF